VPLGGSGGLDNNDDDHNDHDHHNNRRLEDEIVREERTKRKKREWKGTMTIQAQTGIPPASAVIGSLALLSSMKRLYISQDERTEGLERLMEGRTDNSRRRTATANHRLNELRRTRVAI